MKFEVLLSCMNQKDLGIIKKSHLLDVNTLIVNQCEVSNEKIITDHAQIHKMICSPDKGLSRSRNRALRGAHGELCLISDDDEVFYENVAYKVETAYDHLPDADVICFKFDYPDRKKWPNKIKKINRFSALKVISWQISFKHRSIVDAGITFDERFGSGTAIGSGEENIFLCDCLRNGLHVYYVPIVLGKVDPSESQWQAGYNRKSFYSHGMKSYRILGSFWGWIYCMYFALSKYRFYRGKYSIVTAIRDMYEGFNEIRD